MSALRDIWTDLVDKRLWPLAAALLIALVAIPTLLLEPAASPKPLAPTAAETGPAPLVTDPAQITAARPGGPVVGEFKDPFKQQHVRKAEAPGGSGGSSAGPGTTSPGTTSTTETGAGAGGPGGTSGPSGGGDGPARPRPEPAADGVKRVKVRFGPSNRKLKVRVLTPGAPIPSANNPVLVFVEVGRRDQAEFLVSSDATPQGDGRCKPSRAICAQLFAGPGDTEFFDVMRPSGPVQYQLEVLDVIG